MKAAVLLLSVRAAGWLARGESSHLKLWRQLVEWLLCVRAKWVREKCKFRGSHSNEFHLPHFSVHHHILVVLHPFLASVYNLVVDVWRYFPLLSSSLSRFHKTNLDNLQTRMIHTVARVSRTLSVHLHKGICLSYVTAISHLNRYCRFKC